MAKRSAKVTQTKQPTVIGQSARLSPLIYSLQS
jgi:hypothetical protein